MKVIKNIGLVVITLVLWIAIRQYLLCPQYTFQESKPFKGNLLYNPYEKMKVQYWAKCNFHAHTKAWNGITNGKGTAKDVKDAYDRLGYDVSCVSDYHKINDDYRNEPNYISSYEHGYNILKTHQLVLGGDDIVFLDYFFPQTLSNKQDILNKIGSDAASAVIINHPSIRNGYKEEDFKYLNNYHCMEVVSPYQTSFSYWDAALSSGKPVFIVANDDIHNVYNMRSMGRHCTWVNTDTITQAEVLKALKDGNSYAMLVADWKDTDDEVRTKRLRNELPYLQSFTVVDSLIQLELSESAQQVQFFGQNGKLLSNTSQEKTVKYAIQSSDTYIRTVVTFKDGTQMMLNPVFRYQDNQPFRVSEATLPMFNIYKTFLLRLIGSSILVGWLYLLYYTWLGKSIRRRKYSPKLTN